MDAYRLPAYDAAILTQSSALADYYEAAVREAGNPKAVSNWIMSELLRELGSDDEGAIARCAVTPAHLGRLVRLIDGGTISGKIAKDVFEKMLRSGEAPDAIVAREGLTQMADTGALEAVVDQVLASNPRPLEDWKKGKTAAAQAFVGLVMKATGGKANPAIVKRLLEAKLPKV